VNVYVASYPTFTCSVKKPAIFLIKHPIKWERHGRDGSKEVITVLANVETALRAEYSVKPITGMSILLTFLQGL
jgi:hypothetical protein